MPPLAAMAIPSLIGLGGSVIGALGSHKQQKQNAAYTNNALGGLGAMGQTGLANMNRASGAYEGMLANPEQWTGGTAADLAQQSQQQLGTLARTVGRSGMAGASARNLLTENTKNNMQTRLQARMGALQGMTNLAGMGESAYRGVIGGAAQQAQTQLGQNSQNQSIFGGIGGGLYDIFKNMPKKGGGLIPLPGGETGGSIGGF
jgi:hypothetical protein